MIGIERMADPKTDVKIEKTSGRKGHMFTDIDLSGGFDIRFAIQSPFAGRVEIISHSAYSEIIERNPGGEVPSARGKEFLVERRSADAPHIVIILKTRNRAPMVVLIIVAIVTPPTPIVL